mgnify:CR=1 FL=1
MNKQNEPNFVLMEHRVESFTKAHDESDADALRRILSHSALEGWEIIDICGDEVHMPKLIFHRSERTGYVPQYIVEETSTDNQSDEQAVNEKFVQYLNTSWVPACVLDKLFSPPIVVMKKIERPCTDVRAIKVGADLFASLEDTLVYELLIHQMKDNLELACVMHGGIDPTLIMIAKDPNVHYEYLVEHAKGGIFRNQVTSLAELIEERTDEGWQVAGTFEDALFWPCVIFQRNVNYIPVPTPVMLETERNIFNGSKIVDNLQGV